MRRAREIWAASQRLVDPARLVFVDETAARTDMARRYGRCPRGQRLESPVPHGHWKTTTFVAALTPAGMAAPTVVDGATDGETFEAWVRQQLVPCLRPGDAVVMDNLACHKRAGVRRAVEGAGCSLLFLPAYSPDLNPIELAFSRLKWLLRSAAERTAEGLWRLLGRLADSFPPAMCSAFFRHCGYASQTL